MSQIEVSKDNYTISVNEDISDFTDINGTEKQIIKGKKLPSKLKWKIDLMIMPFFIAIYFLQYLDKTLINYAAIMGLTKHLKGNEFSNLGTIFYVAYLAVEPLSAFLIQKLPVSIFLGVNICCWGAIVSLHACTTKYAELMVIRVLLGIFEASVAGCLIIIMGMWWTKVEQTRRTCLWYMQVGTAQIIGSVISYGFQHVKSTAIASWQIMFIFMGILTFLVGVLVIIFLPDNPLKCKYLTEEEKEMVIDHIRENQNGMENRTYKFHQVKELLLEAETWILFFIVVFSLAISGGIGNFSSQIIKSFGFSNEKSAIIQIPMGVVSYLSTIVCCYIPSYIGERSLMITISTTPSILGAALFMGLGDSYKVGKLFGVYLLGSNGAVVAAVYSWNATNTAGHTKRIAKNTMTLMAFCIGNLIGPQLFLSKYAPQYTPGKIVMLVFLALAWILSIVLRFVTVKENKRRDAIAETMTEEEKNADHLMDDLTDRENINFRYKY